MRAGTHARATPPGVHRPPGAFPAAPLAGLRPAHCVCVPSAPRPAAPQTGESLVELVKAVMWSAGNVAGAARTGEGTATPELCLELLIALALRNRDRAGLIWPLLHEYLAACTKAQHGGWRGGGGLRPGVPALLRWPCAWARPCPPASHPPQPTYPHHTPTRTHLPAAPTNNPLVERAVTGLLRICQRLLPYKEDTAETLLRRYAGGGLVCVCACGRGVCAHGAAARLAPTCTQLAAPTLVADKYPLPPRAA